MSRTIFSGWTKLVGSNVVTAMLQLAAFAIVARALSLEALGLILVIQTYVRVVDLLLNFQSVSVLTRFLAEAHEQGNEARFAGLVKAGFVIDVGTALLAFAVTCASLPLIGPIFGIDGDWLPLATAYATVILTRTFGSGEAALRCYDRFWTIGLRPAIQAALLLAATTVAWVADAGPATFLWIWLVTEALANIAFICWSIFIVRSNNQRSLVSASARQAIAESPRFWASMWQINITSGIRMLSQDADLLVAASLVGPAAASLLKAAKSLASVIGQLSRPLQQVVSAPIARLRAQGSPSDMQSYAWRISLFAGMASFLFVAGSAVAGGLVLWLVYGLPFVEAHMALTLMMATAMLYMFGVTLLPLGLALDRPDISLVSTLAGTLAFALALAALVGPFGIEGIAIAHVILNAVWLAVGWSLIHKAVQKQAAE
ncbi:lipopolysaccharide biosynthesis protein [Altererythrobacter sp. KTW20L]|uniref:lipopolysaccharide biosynthesis protein n=1 Tax=Altererythrobacter sp. KTW20L TaxID=2942210 RepID=UPI0020BEEF9C|nr:lipopolysaccharide biosynthesis protein [Altererythrobacter sp. KTW20L]MCL6249533.1 lipopolysaccharide biosynthesis protein [Altererythrobacter sp. KTW20L]